MQVGIVLFVLIIVAGFVAGLCLSAPGAQRRAVIVAFASMMVVAVLFYVFAMRASQLWLAPVFAIACIAVPIGAYAALMKSQDSAESSVTRRNPVEVPRADLPAGVSRTLRSSSPLEAAVMPPAPGHPASEFQDLDGSYQPYNGELYGENLSGLSGEPPAYDGYQEIYLEEDDFELAEDMEDLGLSGPLPVMQDEFEEDDFELAEDMDELEEEDDEEVDIAEPPMLSQVHEAGSPTPQAPEPTPSLPASPAEQLLDEALMEENEDQDASGLFEPEVMPDPFAAEPTTSVTSTTVVAVPSEAGEEEYLVVSESTEAPNPLLAYKRTTSSHLVPLGPSHHLHEEEPFEPTPRPRIELARESELAPPASTAVIMSVVSRELDAMRQPAVPFDGMVAEAQPSLFDEPPVEAEVPFYNAPEAVAEDLFGGFEPEPPAAYAPGDPEAAYVAQPMDAMAPAPMPQPGFGAPATYEPQPGFTPQFADAPQAAFEPQPGYAPSPAPAPMPMAAPAPAPMPAPEPAPAPKPRPKPKATFSYQPLVIEPVPESASSSSASSEPTSQSAESAAKPAAAPAASSAFATAPAAAPAPSAEPAVEPGPAPAPEPPAPKTLFEIAVEKADGLRERGMYPVAARLYAQAAQEAATGDERRRVQFEEIACYLKAGQNDKARDLAAQLRSSRVLTRAERIKLDAIDRMG